MKIDNELTRHADVYPRNRYGDLRGGPASLRRWESSEFGCRGSQRGSSRPRTAWLLNAAIAGTTPLCGAVIVLAVYGAILVVYGLSHVVK